MKRWWWIKTLLGTFRTRQHEELTLRENRGGKSCSVKVITPMFSVPGKVPHLLFLSSRSPAPVLRLERVDQERSSGLPLNDWRRMWFRNCSINSGFCCWICWANCWPLRERQRGKERGRLIYRWTESAVLYYIIYYLYRFKFYMIFLYLLWF